MRGVVSHWIFNGYKRIMGQTIYFAIPLAAGEHSLLPGSSSASHLALGRSLDLVLISNR